MSDQKDWADLDKTQKVDVAFAKPHTCDNCGTYTRAEAYWDSVASFSWICKPCWPIVVERSGPSAH